MTDPKPVTREQFYEAFAQAWIDARPHWDVLDTQLASALAARLGLEDGHV